VRRRWVDEKQLLIIILATRFLSLKVSEFNITACSKRNLNSVARGVAMTSKDFFYLTLQNGGTSKRDILLRANYYTALAIQQ
jgi:hypothetical protein